MRGALLNSLKKIHTFLGVFFAPLLILFIVSGIWQVLTPHDTQDAPSDTFNQFMSNLSTIHTDSALPNAPDHHSKTKFKVLVSTMGIALTLTIVLGIVVAWQTGKNRWPIVIALILGILTPILLLIL